MQELYHHGVKGQHWGIQNGPPYPISRSGLTRDQKLSAKNLKKAETANLDKFGKDRNHNVLYIAGYSGSGKSTMASGIARKNDKIIRLDMYADPVDKTTRNLMDKGFNKYCSNKGVDYKKIQNAHKKNDGYYNSKQYWKDVDKLRNAIEGYSKQEYDNGNRVIVEGIQISAKWLAGDHSYYKDKPVIIMRTPILKSMLRASARDDVKGFDVVKKAIENYGWYERSNKKLDALAKETNTIKNGKQYVDMILRKGE